MSIPKISICIPAYEMHGQGKVMLQQLLTSIHNQNYQNKEVIVADHTIHQSLGTICGRFPGTVYVPNAYKRGNPSANMNVALDHVTGDYIKPMFQDDLFMDSDSLLSIYNELEQSHQNWLVAGFKTYTSNPQQINKSYWPPVLPIDWDTVMQKNGLGTPSGLLYKKCDLRFDEDLTWIMDCDFYYRLYKLYGDPCIGNKFTILVRFWPGSVSNTICKPQLPSLFDKETSIVQEKYKRMYNAE